MRVFVQLAVGVSLALSLSACTGSGGKTTAPNRPQLLKTTRETYLSGQKFCAVYSEFTSKEVPVRVEVPRDYANPSAGTISIYAYTPAPFDPSKPSYIYLDGGSGQNTHGMMPEYMYGTMNEIRFDQRGLGCSAPDTYDQFLDPSLYSTENTVKDMEEIRKAYGINTWTVYGVSYGTVPATMYASLYASRTKASVLEGVVGDPTMIHDMKYKAAKLNLVLGKLTAPEKRGFEDLLVEDAKEQNGSFFFGYMEELFFADRGMSDLPETIRILLRADGSFDRERYARNVERILSTPNRFPYAQQPGAVDSDVHYRISCKNLGMRNRPAEYLSYTPQFGFYIGTYQSFTWGQACDEAGVPASDAKTYRIELYKTSVPTYYFQGAHDGATNATGALKHFQTVPQGSVYFLLAQRGGHNPNLSRIASEDSVVKMSQLGLFGKALKGDSITNGDLSAINPKMTGQNWMLYTSPSSAWEMAPYFDGLRATSAAQAELGGLRVAN